MFCVNLSNVDTGIDPYDLARLDKINISWITTFGDERTNNIKNIYIRMVKAKTPSLRWLIYRACKSFEIYNKDKLEWCAENCAGKFGVKFNNKWYFENKQDMILFKLRWV